MPATKTARREEPILSYRGIRQAHGCLSLCRLETQRAPGFEIGPLAGGIFAFTSGPPNVDRLPALKFTRLASILVMLPPSERDCGVIDPGCYVGRGLPVT